MSRHDDDPASRNPTGPVPGGHAGPVTAATGTADPWAAPHGNGDAGPATGPDAAVDGGGDRDELAPEQLAELEGRRRRLRLVVDIAVVVACVAFALWHLQPDLLVRNTTPAGGDMGAHVWGPAYLRDHLLPHGQVAGWTGAWYAGFPAYQFYMVVPSLLIVLVNAGVHGWAALVPAALGLGAAAVAVVRWGEARVRWPALAVAGASLLLVGLPYGVAFKLVSVSGVATLPIAAYAFGRLAGTRFPTPAVLAVATLPFLFYRGYTIYGGNVASTLAGEFAFSISLSLAVVYAGVVLKGLETGRYRALAAVLLALTGLCHIIPAFWALGATVVAVAVRFRFARDRAETGVPVVLGGVLAVLGGGAVAVVLGDAGSTVGLGIAGAGAVTVLAGVWLLSDSVRWLTPALVVGGLLSMWWVAPFYLRSDYVNDMGWEKLPYADPEMSRTEEWLQHLLPGSVSQVSTPENDLRWVFAITLVGLALSVTLVATGVLSRRHRLTGRDRAGIFLVLVTVAMGVAFVVVPEGRLWNGRLLPFYYLTALLLVGWTVSEVARIIGEAVRAGRREPLGAGIPATVGALAVTVVLVGVPLGQLPFTEHLENGYAWPRFSPLQVRQEPGSFVPSWARWNYSGYEGKDAYREYHAIVETMRDLGEQRGCGRAFWEYEKELDRYGTPMALMLLPHWTDGCIASMEGLFFESSATTPFHFLTQVELSTAPSAAQRDMPYGQFDIDKGVAHLQMMGVRYYMATSDNAVNQARGHEDLTEIATSGPWVVFEVAGSEVVSPLENQPAVVAGIDHSQHGWVEEPLDESGRFGGPAVRWFNDPNRWSIPLASSGPDDWQRIELGEDPEAVPLDPVEVSDVEVDDQRLSFEVDQVGVPVVVKMSYFPNWRVTGAEGPYRVAPNFMVVIPNDTRVELTYGRTGVEYLAYALTLLGVAGLVLLIRRPAPRFADDGADGRAGDHHDADDPDAADPDADEAGGDADAPAFVGASDVPPPADSGPGPVARGSHEGGRADDDREAGG